MKICHYLVYRKDSKSYSSKSENDNFQVFSFSSAEDCNKQLSNILKDPCSLRFSLDQYVDRGRVFWLGINDNIIVSVAYALQGTKCEQYFFDLKADEVYISGCQTHPNYRGFGLYAHLLQTIMDRLAKEGFRAFYIHTQNWNWPSSCGIQKAGFEHIGYGWEKRG